MYVNYVRRPFNIRFRINRFNKWDDYDFKARFRLSKETVIEVTIEKPGLSRV